MEGVAIELVVVTSDSNGWVLRPAGSYVGANTVDAHYSVDFLCMTSLYIKEMKKQASADGRLVGTL